MAWMTMLVIGNNIWMLSYCFLVALIANGHIGIDNHQPLLQGLLINLSVNKLVEQCPTTQSKVSR